MPNKNKKNEVIYCYYTIVLNVITVLHYHKIITCTEKSQ